jgi:hypothetical protein
MAFDLGDVVPLSITIADPSGALADAGQVTVTVTLPDGTADSQAVNPTVTGLYDYDYPTVQAGRHNVRWVATGTNASAYSDAFDVQPADDGDFISVADAKHHLKRQGTTSAIDDEKLRSFVSSACQMITDRMGQVSPTTVVHDVTKLGDTIVLPTRPVISVTSVQRLPGLAVLPQADEGAGVHGWKPPSVEGVLEHTTTFGGRVRVTYRAGRTPLPANFRLAALELTGHLWRTSQHNPAAGRPVLQADEQVVPGVTFALPYTVRQLLGLDKRPQDEILVG